MPIGPLFRRMLGPLERPVSELYRSIFVDITAFVGQIQQWVSPFNILELGCGEGAVIERLAKTFPKANLTGIDISPKVGRMFQGDSSRVIFKQQNIKNFASENLASFDFLVISDVMHHIPWEHHKEILMDARKALKPGGYLVLKDWERNTTVIHLLCYLSERYITGDHVRYKTADELRALIEETFGTNCIKAETRIKPRANNIAFLVQC